MHTHPNIDRAATLLTSVVRDADTLDTSLAAIECAAALDALHSAGAAPDPSRGQPTSTTPAVAAAIEAAVQLLAALPPDALTDEVLDALDNARAARAHLPG